jgi:hypothetical protein
MPVTGLLYPFNHIMESAIIPNNNTEVIICDDKKGTRRPVLTCIVISGHKCDQERNCEDSKI